MDAFQNSADPDATSHQGLHCLLRQTQYLDKEIQYILEILNCCKIAGFT